MKKALLVVAVLFAAHCLEADVYTFNGFNSSRNYENGILFQAEKGTSEEGPSMSCSGNNNCRINILSGSTVTVNTGCVNINSIVLHLYSGSDMPHMSMTANEGSIDTTLVPEMTITWTNPGYPVANVVLTLVETDEPSNVTYDFQKNRIQIASADIDMDGEYGYYDVVDGVLKDTIDIVPSKIIMNSVFDTFWEEYYYSFEVTDKVTGHIVTLTYEPEREGDCTGEYDDYGWPDLTSGHVDIPGGESYDGSYKYLNIQKNEADTSQYDVKMFVIAKNLILYRLDYTGALTGEVKNSKYDLEPKTSETFNIAVTEADYSDYNLNYYNELEVNLFDKDYNMITLVFMVNAMSKNNVIPVGEYKIDDTKAIGTVMASSGYDDYGATEGSMLEFNTVEMADDSTEYLDAYATYFIVSGNVSVQSSEKGLKIVVAAKSYNGSTINAAYEGTVPGESTALEYLRPTDTDAPMYNVLGIEVGKDYKGIVIQGGRKRVQNPE